MPCHKITQTLSLLLLTSTITITTAQNDPLGPGAHSQPNAGLIVVGLVLAGFVVALFYLFLCDADLRRGTHSLLPQTTARAVGPAPTPLPSHALYWLPVVQFARVKSFKPVRAHQQLCSICLDEFQDDDSVRIFRHCSHVFHRLCVDQWLQLRVHCPVCRADVSRPPANAAVLEDQRTSVVGEQSSVEMEANWRWNSTGHEGVATVEPFRLVLPERVWRRILADHRRSSSLTRVPVEGEMSRRGGFVRGEGRFSLGRLSSFLSSLSRRGEYGDEEQGMVEMDGRTGPQGRFRRAVSSAGRYVSVNARRLDRRGGSAGRWRTEMAPAMAGGLMGEVGGY